MQPVRDLIILKSTKSSIKLQWKQVPLVYGYIITAQAYNINKLSIYNLTYPYNRRKEEVVYKVTDLKPNTTYVLSVRSNQLSSKAISVIGKTLGGK